MSLHELYDRALKGRVKGKVNFSFYRDGALWYKCSYDGYEFPVPVEETKNNQGSSPTFLAEDKGIVYMRWIRKYMDDYQLRLREREEDDNA